MLGQRWILKTLIITIISLASLLTKLTEDQEKEAGCFPLRDYQATKTLSFTTLFQKLIEAEQLMGNRLSHNLSKLQEIILEQLQESPTLTALNL